MCRRRHRARRAWHCRMAAVFQGRGVARAVRRRAREAMRRPRSGRDRTSFRGLVPGRSRPAAARAGHRPASRHRRTRCSNRRSSETCANDPRAGASWRRSGRRSADDESRRGRRVKTAATHRAATTHRTRQLAFARSRTVPSGGDGDLLEAPVGEERDDIAGLLPCRQACASRCQQSAPPDRCRARAARGGRCRRSLRRTRSGVRQVKWPRRESRRRTPSSAPGGAVARSRSGGGDGRRRFARRCRQMAGSARRPADRRETCTIASPRR